MAEAEGLSLEQVAIKLGVSPSAIKKRVAALHLPVLRGPRGKLIFDARAFALLAEADGLLKAGHGFEECRKRLGLEEPIEVAAEGPDARPPRPVYVQLRARRRNLPAPPPPPPPGPDPALLAGLFGRIDALIQRLDVAEAQNGALNAKLLAAYEEIARLQNELRGLPLLPEPPKEAKPWWKVW